MSDGEIAILHAAVRRAVKRSSIRDVARQSGMSHGGVHNIVSGNTNRTYGATIRKLRDWYLREWASGGNGLTPEVAAYVVKQIVAPIADADRAGAYVELVRALERIYESHSTPRPAWLSAVQNELPNESITPELTKKPPLHQGSHWGL